MKKIIVTGGAGYIGSHTVIKLIENGYFPIIIDNFSNSSYDVIEKIEEIAGNKFYIIRKDISEDIDDWTIDDKIHGIIHFASLKSISESIEKPDLYYKNNIGSTKWVLNFMKKKNIKNLIFSSSAVVYGEPDLVPITEDMCYEKSNNPYGISKQESEKIINAFSNKNKSKNVVKLRYFNPIGAHKSGLIGEIPSGIPNNLLPYLLDVASGEREILNIFGGDYNTPDGTCIRDFIHVEDLANAHVEVLNWLLNKKGINKDFNVGTGKGHSVMQIIDTFKKISNIDLKYKITNRRKGDIDKIWADVSKIKKEVGWESKFTLEESLIDSWNFKLKNKKVILNN